MRLIEERNSFLQENSACVATIGKFDGFHLGHQLILDQLKAKAEEFGLPTVVISSEPHPEEFFAAQEELAPARLTPARLTPARLTPARLTNVDEKARLLEKFGIDYFYPMPFDHATSQLAAELFVEEFLVKSLAVRCVIVGSDFHFGRNRAGNFDLLEKIGQTHGFEVIVSTTYKHKGLRVSSSYVREVLNKGAFDLIPPLLGRPYAITGTVVRGQQLGHQLGFPTSNVDLKRRRAPLHGVFVVQVEWQGKCYPGVANIGNRPTVEDSHRVTLEVHLLDFEADLYGETISVVFLQQIRAEQKFSSLEELKLQIAKDVDVAKDYFTAD